MYSISKEIFNIKRVQLRVLEPVEASIPFQDASMGPFQSFGLAIIIVEDEEGHIGESPVYSSYTNILETCLLPILLHSKNMPYDELYKQLYWAIRNEGFRGQASALLGQIDLALHDLAARKAKKPLHVYLNARTNKVRVYGSGGGTNYSLKELEKEVGYFLEHGVDCYKMKVGKSFGKRMEEDIDRVKFVRALLGKNIKLAVDANQIWTCEEALSFIDQIGHLDICWFEEPLHSAAYEQIEQLCKKTSVKVSYGESERTSRMFPTLINMGVQHLQPVPTQIGSVREWTEVSSLAKIAGIDFSSGGYSLYTASLMATTGENFQVEYLHSIMSGLEEYFAIKPEWSNGCFQLPDVDGLPVRIDWNYVKKRNKIIRSQLWSKENVKTYLPNVSM